MPSDKANKEPILTKDELDRVNDVIQWSQTHENCMNFGVLVTVPRLIEFMYEISVVGAVGSLAGKSTRVPIDPSPPIVNTWGATARKDKGKTQVADKGKSKIVDKGKGKITEPEKPVFIPLRTDGALKIFESKGPIP